MNPLFFLKDVRAGLVSLSLKQLKAVRAHSPRCDLVVTTGDIVAAGFAHALAGGVPGTLASDVAGLTRPLVSAATAYFVFNTCLIAIAVALSTRQAFFAVWNQNYLWSAPSYFVGASAATSADLRAVVCAVRPAASKSALGLALTSGRRLRDTQPARPCPPPCFIRSLQCDPKFSLSQL